MQNNSIIYTNWFAVDGAPCSGKSTLVKALSEKTGWGICPDFARILYSEEMAKGINFNEILNKQQYYQDKISGCRLERMRKDNPSEFLLHEYGLPSDLVWHEERGAAPSADLVRACSTFRYRRVFILDMLPNQHDDIRHESNRERIRIHRRLWDTYQSLGYTPVRVPAFCSPNTKISVLQRMDMILEEIQLTCRMPLVPRYTALESA